MWKSVIGVLNRVIKILSSNLYKALKTLADILSILTDLNVKVHTQPEMEGYEYGYAILEPLGDINVSCTKSTPLSSLTIANIETNDWNNVMIDHD